MEDEVMKRLYITFVLVIVVGVLVGCSGGTATPVSEGAAETYTSAVLIASYPDALSASGQLALGTLQLEETGSAVTPEQAAALLPLWQALQGGVTAQAEVNAVLRQIEGTMTPQQLLAIAGMQLTQENLQAWMQENDIRPGGVFSGTLGGTPGPEGVPQAGFGGGPPGDGTVSPEMATRRAEFENMSDAEREAMRATMEAGGGRPGGPGGRQGGRFGGGGGQFMILLNPLIELLEARAGEA
jgi:hypothetical protein